MQTSIARHPDIMAVVDVDPKAMDPVIKKAIKAGIPVIDINSRGDVKKCVINADTILHGKSPMLLSRSDRVIETSPPADASA